MVGLRLRPTDCLVASIVNRTGGKSATVFYVLAQDCCKKLIRRVRSGAQRGKWQVRQIQTLAGLETLLYISYMTEPLATVCCLFGVHTRV